MDRIASESFERVLRDKYGIEWMDSLNRYMYLDEYEKAWDCKEVGLVGAMVSELMARYWEFNAEATTYSGMFEIVIGHDGAMIEHVEGKGLYEALKKAVESISW